MITQQLNEGLKGELSGFPGPWVMGVSNITWLFEGNFKNTRHASDFHEVHFFSQLLQPPCASS